MNILMLSPENISQAHGGAVHTLAVARAFIDLEHKVTLVSPGEKSDHDTFVHIKNEMRRGPVASTCAAAPLEDVLSAEKFDLIYERQLLFGGQAALWGKKWDLPVIFEVNSPHRLELLKRYPLLNLINFYLKKLEKKMFSSIKGVVTTHKNLIPDHYKGNSVVGPWAVKVERHHEFELPPDLKDKKIILFSGSFQSWHAFEFLKPVLKNVKPGPWALVLAGKLTDDSALKELQEALSFPVVSLGALSQKDLHSLCRQSHVLLAPFKKPLENMDFYYSPFKILEALASALPVVTNDYENLKNLMTDHWCGYYISRRHEELWTSSLLSILEADKVDAEFGLSYEKGHSWTSHVNNFLKKLMLDE